MQWIKNWFSRKTSVSVTSVLSLVQSRVSRKKRRTSFRPQVEPLEEKVLLAVFSPTYSVLHPYGYGSFGPWASAGPPASALTPTQIRNAYGINGITFQSNGGTIAGNGAGETIAIVDAYDDPSISADLAAFDQQFGIAAPPSFVKVGINRNGVASTTSFPTANSGWAGEIELDVEWAHAIAPAASILLVEAYNATDSSLMTAVDYARNYSGVVAVSMSWGQNEFAGQTVYDSHFTTPAGHTGVTFFASSGDSSTIGYPATSSHVVSVGGTSLNVDSAGNYLGESAWSGSGGGLSQVIGQPSYQNNLVIHSGSRIVPANGMRAGPDVAFNADPYTGVAVYGAFGFGGWAQVGGTSAGAPAWAGLMAIVDQGRLPAGQTSQTSLDGYTQTLPALYALPSSDFHDITTGSNGNVNGSAGPGFDLVTGRGTPVANLLVAALSGNTSTTTASPPTVGVISIGTSTSTSVNLSVVGTDPAGDPSPIYTWTVTGTPPGAVTFTSNGASNSNATTAQFTQAGFYTIQVTVTDHSSGLSVTSQVQYTVSQVLTSVSVSPASATVAVGTTAQFIATALDQFGAAMASQPSSFNWSVVGNSVGSVNSTGLYTAPSGTGTATIQASITTTGGTFTGSASVSVVIQSATTTTLSAGPVFYHRRYALSTLTVQVFPPPGSTVLPTGTIDLYYAGSVLGTATIQIVNGIATAQFIIQFNANGIYTFSAQYMGSSSFQGSTSNAVTVIV